MSCRAMLNPGSMEHEVVSVPMSRPDDAVTAPSRVRMTRPRDNEGRFARSDSGSDVARCACVQASRPPQLVLRTRTTCLTCPYSTRRSRSRRGKQENASRKAATYQNRSNRPNPFCWPLPVHGARRKKLTDTLPAVCQGPGARGTGGGAWASRSGVTRPPRRQPCRVAAPFALAAQRA